ncbi:MAG TPA: potassium transporter [Bacteroidales bacterium]|nr:potassium transporter [Bacteroidales bacterium]
MSFSIIFSVYYQQDDWLPILISCLITSGFGLILFFSTTKEEVPTMGRREGYIIVAFAWVLISLYGAFPFFLHGSIPSFTDAYFETMSGFTTTGASILTDIEALPKGLLFWRSVTQWIGGMGIIVFSLAILPFLGIGGMQLFVAEVPGPVADKLHPRIHGTARRLWIIYVILTAALTILLMVGKLDFFDSLCHAFTTMATGGFSTKNDSIASFTSFNQYIIIVFMFLAGVNFTLHYFMLKGKFKVIFKNEEWRSYLLTIIIATVIIWVVLFFVRGDLEGSFRTSLFQVVSLITTTGFATDDYLQWPFVLMIILMILFFIGGCAGSTGGGVKVVRQVLLFKTTRIELKRMVHPNMIHHVKLNKISVSKDILFNVLAFFLIYLIAFVVGSLALNIIGLDFMSAIGGSMSCLGNVGPGFGTVGPVLNYASVPDSGKWILAFLMLIGRLELFTVLILFSPSFWKK